MPTSLLFGKSRSFRLLLLPLLSVVVLSGCGLFRPSADYQIPTAQPLSIALPANFSTGYRWVLDPPLQTARLLDESYSSPSLPGAPGTQTVRVVFPREGRFNLKFAYRRLWEPASVPSAQTTNVIVEVISGKENRPLMERLFTKDIEPASNVPQPEEEEPRTKRRVEMRRP